MKSMENFKRGDIVWARVLFPQKWWPGVVLRIDILGVLVSFFGLQNYRYFLESEIVPFEPNFKSFCTNCNCSTSIALLDHALNLFGQRNLFDMLNRRRKASNLFNPQVALGFVRNVAISSWIEEDDFINAVRALAQVMAFRHYSFTSSKPPSIFLFLFLRLLLLLSVRSLRFAHGLSDCFVL